MHGDSFGMKDPDPNSHRNNPMSQSVIHEVGNNQGNIGAMFRKSKHAGEIKDGVNFDQSPMNTLFKN